MFNLGSPSLVLYLSQVLNACCFAGELPCFDGCKQLRKLNCASNNLTGICSTGEMYVPSYKLGFMKKKKSLDA